MVALTEIITLILIAHDDVENSISKEIHNYSAKEIQKTGVFFLAHC